ncbi:hypothetical protein SUGI_0128610 [Cryptomeria japonica]|nr:hypothetical protein SUGI_0128610 [Cryptomeria japonica]
MDAKCSRQKDNLTTWWRDVFPQQYFVEKDGSYQGRNIVSTSKDKKVGSLEDLSKRKDDSLEPSKSGVDSLPPLKVATLGVKVESLSVRMGNLKEIDGTFPSMEVRG